MIELIAQRSGRGDVFVNLAKIHLANHEWGLALRAVQAGMEKGGLVDPPGANCLLREIHSCIGTPLLGEPGTR